uniref:Uncharacterized protein n=1 Tax=viral metagenome TaxID=1070528 RepID=A0A6C0KL37_9ZZZZ
MAHFPDYEIIPCGNFYQYNGELYAKQFPTEWAQNHLEGTGPHSCTNCRAFGSWNGVFIGYCVNCAQYDYEFSRGHGFLKPGQEISKKNANTIGAMQSYLKDIDPDCIGDREIFDSYAVHYGCNDSDDFAEELYHLESTILEYYKNKENKENKKDDDQLLDDQLLDDQLLDDQLSEASDYDSANESDDELNTAVILDDAPLDYPPQQYCFM